MYIIKDKNNRFIKKTIDNQITFTNNESLADAFSSEREANDVIRKTFTKKNRKNFKAVWCDINPVPESTIGQLSVVFRTQSMALIQAMTEFFRLWKQIEDTHLKPLTGAKIDYALYDGKFVRSIAAPDRDCTTDELAAALSEYIKLFDKLMKAYLAGRLDEHDVEAAYFSQMRNSPVHI